VPNSLSSIDIPVHVEENIVPLQISDITSDQNQVKKEYFKI
jgi:hypothetical protein